MDIKNFVKVNDSIYTSGQPKEDEFGLIAQAGIKTVINLAMPDSDTAIANEGVLVTAQGMNYVHIPVVWKAPETAQFTLFANIMNAHENEKVWVHCALNWRVSSFIYLYKRKVLGLSHEEAYPDLIDMWEPNEDWQAFITSVLEE